jgi:hypothetical protein
MNARLISEALPSDRFPNKYDVHGFRAQACGLPGNDAVVP